MILKKRIEGPVMNFITWVLTIAVYVAVILILAFLAWKIGLPTFVVAFIVWAFGEGFASVGGNYPPGWIYVGIFTPLVTILVLLFVSIGIPLVVGIRRAMKQ